MKNQNSSKLAAIAVALLINTLIFGAAAFLFDGRAQHTLDADSVALSAAHAVHVV